MLTVSINGESVQFNNSITIEALLLQQGNEKRRLAVAVNGEFVPRSQYARKRISHGDEIDIVTAVGGG